LRLARLPEIRILPERLTPQMLKEAIPGSDLEALRLDEEEIERVVALVQSQKHPYS